jgi:hypothetical protein
LPAARLPPILAAAPVKLAAQASSPPQLGSISASGNYLAARHAGSNATPGQQRRITGRRSNVIPATVKLLDRAFLSFLVDGEVMKPSNMPIASFSLTRTIVLLGSCSACTHSNASNIRRHAAILPNPSVDRSPISRDIAVGLEHVWRQRFQRAQ